MAMKIKKIKYFQHKKLMKLKTQHNATLHSNNFNYNVKYNNHSHAIRQAVLNEHAQTNIRAVCQRRK